MKIALYIENGVDQVVLTPETDTEKSILAKIVSGQNMTVYKGHFYHCQGGWNRQGGENSSTIIRLTDP